MKYIKQLHIQNFQSHQDTTLDLVNGLNTIIGESDKGKSAIIRAIRWVILNDPQGNNMVRQGTKECSVTLTLSDETKITRTKKLSGKKKITSKNTYKIEYPNGDISENENFGVDSIPEVLQACGVNILKIDKDLVEIPNFAFQLDPPFLVSSNGSQRSKTIGKLINANLFDSSIRDIKADILDINRKTKEKSAEYEALNEKLKQYEDVEEEEKKLSKIENFISQAEKTEKNIDTLKRYISSLQNIKLQKSKCMEVIDKLSDIEEAQLNIKDLELKHKESLNFQKTSASLKSINTNKNLLKDTITKLSNIEEAEKINSNLINTIDKLSKIQLLKNKIDYLDNHNKNLKITLTRLQNIDSINETYLKLQNLNSKTESLQKINKEYKVISNEKAKLRNAIIKMPDFNQIEKLHLDYTNIQTKIETIKQLSTNYKDTKLRLKKGSDYIKTVQAGLNQCTQAYSDMLKNMGKCPTCFNDIDNTTVQNIISNL
ncbi:AAA family ATPase [Tepidibacter aestuarii]|uniref:AAA family ATPase n=1 Tax=Tepidibacter aestuarii TaxID=2925782 RepID=UPI0020BDB76A|nr:AAA family ATPase [Tepidibacter aestuarii]CAH2215109.1 DNA repair protein RecN [Tepidibacter aestuarii]